MKEFFDIVRARFGVLNQGQVEGFELLVKRTVNLTVRHRAYILATAWHETAKTMQPIEEYGRGKGKKYGVPDAETGQIYYGRGYVQITWKTNYDKACQRLKELKLISAGANFVRNPDLVMEPTVAAHILVIGMCEGWFTGKKLSDFDSYENMRRVVNGTDRAQTIAEYARVFENAIRSIKKEPVAPVPDYEVLPGKTDKDLSKVAGKSVAAIIIAAILAAFGAFAAWMINGGAN